MKGRPRRTISPDAPAQPAAMRSSHGGRPTVHLIPRSGPASGPRAVVHLQLSQHPISLLVRTSLPSGFPPSLRPTMLIKESYRDVQTKAGGTMRIIIIEPHVPEYPSAKFPGCVVFSEVCRNAYSNMRSWLTACALGFHFQIYQVTGTLFTVPRIAASCSLPYSDDTGPVERFAGNIASQGNNDMYLLNTRNGTDVFPRLSLIGFVVACPSSFHEFEGPEPIPYDTEGTFSLVHHHIHDTAHNTCTPLQEPTEVTSINSTRPSRATTR